MRTFLVLAVVLLGAALIVLAVVFRDQRARGMLRTLRNAAWIYIAVIFAIGLWRLFGGGF